mmetsp:Transcript_11087/g.16285  ORF Transcript_11087/g.16285 Transcript_11087/m.16285 type:complete len:559 (+) Transcript_11087:190-1866(+)|eukprot:CAMPEP_0194204738 /NCGR_PEP_ID=MMETSP0156-20130528/4180_1 /TAXON_ID=33649 /ORGANISM="Thalassionema nitzschioides, Strain L26-B" /LENGTH=558 /DNA_ID=CAMNT_0038930829 /DNA_START=164 /DNA_END=1840 /DNA_ORIENTATION=-
MKFSALLLVLPILVRSSASSSFEQRSRKLNTCPNGDSCLTDDDCKACRKSPFNACASNNDCSGNGNKCRTTVGSCSSPVPPPTPIPTPTPGTGGSLVCPDKSSCNSDADCQTCTKNPTQACTVDSECSGNGNKCRAPAGSCAQCPNGPATYFPGDLTVTLGGGLATNTLLASTGLSGRVLTREGQAVSLNQGTSFSTAGMHNNADGAATVLHGTDSSKYYLVSNSESTSGGVGILQFDATKTPHDVIGYRRTAENTATGRRNCGGGRTPWGTWLTSEESGTGSVYEVDPNDNTGTDYCRSPIVPPEGGNYESNAYWESTEGDNKYHFYTTNDSGSNYRLTRFIPDDTVTEMLAKPRKLDRLCGVNGTLEYLQLSCDTGCSGSSPSGTYAWSTSRTPVTGDQPYPSAEGIDVKANDLYFVTKGQRRLYMLDLTGTIWTSTATIESSTGATFSPDQVARITGSDSPDDLLYFAEDGSGNKDIHARGLDDNGVYQFFTIIRGYNTTETTGLTFSPDNKYMYFSHQSQSEIWQIWRNDGCTFGNGIYLDVNYHGVVSRYLRY